MTLTFFSLQICAIFENKLSFLFQEFADQCGIPYLETSAKTATNVEEAFMTLSANIKKGFDSGVLKNDSPPFRTSDDRHLDEKSWSIGNICSC